MRLLADENIPRTVIEALARRGHDVRSVVDLGRGASDPQIILSAQRERRIILTFDKDFGGLAFRAGRRSSGGIILLRFVPRDPEDAAAVVMAALSSRADWDGHFAVVERDRIRMRRLPRQA
jgi:predicted nuclease of predicted toxin-antitoxin system